MLDIWYILQFLIYFLIFAIRATCVKLFITCKIKVFFHSCCMLRIFSLSQYLLNTKLSGCLLKFLKSQNMKGNIWHERAEFQQSAFGRSTAGNDVVATIFISLFSPPPFFPIFPQLFFSVTTFYHRRSARIKKHILQKLLRMSKNWKNERMKPQPLGFYWYKC